ncbi:hypothetical protein BGZ54_006642 [Gamsiella multidivaricata]|nr:hypothetical protein BGZ54_006642 [Gamsiella multidivaricata]
MVLEKIRQRFDLSVVKHIDLEDMAIDFTGPDHWTSTLSSDRLVARLTHIPGFTWPIQQVQLTVLVQDKGEHLGSLYSPFTPASVSRGQITSSISFSPLHIPPESHTAFSTFIAALTTQSYHTFTIRGSADIQFKLGRLLGVHALNGVDFLSDLTLRGLNNLPGIKCTDVKDVKSEIHEGQEREQDMLQMTVLLDIPNPSQLSLTLGDITLEVLYSDQTSASTEAAEAATETATAASTISSTDSWVEAEEQDVNRGQQQQQQQEQQLFEENSDHVIGTIHLPGLILLQGANDGRVATLRLDTRLQRTKLFLDDIAKESRTVHLKGFQGTSENEALAAGLVTLATSFIMPSFMLPTDPKHSFK